jgi:hypothetical protein
MFDWISRTNRKIFQAWPSLKQSLRVIHFFLTGSLAYQDGKKYALRGEEKLITSEEDTYGGEDPQNLTITSELTNHS